MTDALTKFLQDNPADPVLSPHWDLKTIDNSTHVVTSYGEPFYPAHYRYLFDRVQVFFKHYYESFGAEAQVVVVRPSDAQKIDWTGIPELFIDYGGNVPHVYVLPQHNTPGITQVSEKLWYQLFGARGITPLMRIHSHHILNAYQSYTDFSSLNSNTLEVVLGKVTQTTPEIAYWIGTPDQKSTVFTTTDYGKTTHMTDLPLINEGGDDD